VQMTPGFIRDNKKNGFGGVRQVTH
jgi:hypothetical protein